MPPSRVKPVQETATTPPSYSQFLLGGLRSWQAPVSGSVRVLAGMVGPLLPSRYVRYPRYLPSVRRVVEQQFSFAEGLLRVERDFASALLDAASPVLACERTDRAPA